MTDDRADFSLDTLIEGLRHPDLNVRVNAGTILGSMKEDAGPAVPALIDLLEHGDTPDRKMAVVTLREIGPAAEAAISALLNAAKKKDEDIPGMAFAALVAINAAPGRRKAA